MSGVAEAFESHRRGILTSLEWKTGNLQRAIGARAELLAQNDYSRD